MTEVSEFSVSGLFERIPPRSVSGVAPVRQAVELSGRLERAGGETAGEYYPADEEN